MTSICLVDIRKGVSHQFLNTVSIYAHSFSGMHALDSTTWQGLQVRMPLPRALSTLSRIRASRLALLNNHHASRIGTDYKGLPINIWRLLRLDSILLCSAMVSQYQLSPFFEFKDLKQCDLLACRLSSFQSATTPSWSRC